MEYSGPPLPQAFYRPAKVLRPLKRQLPTVWVVGIALSAFVILFLFAWRTLIHERTSRNLSIQWSRIETLNKEIQHLRGQIQTETSVSRVARWARDKKGWRERPDLVFPLLVKGSKLTTGARDELRLLEARP